VAPGSFLFPDLVSLPELTLFSVSRAVAIRPSPSPPMMQYAPGRVDRAPLQHEKLTISAW
jgi:hypothetical protein